MDVHGFESEWLLTHSRLISKPLLNERWVRYKSTLVSRWLLRDEKDVSVFITPELSQMKVALHVVLKNSRKNFVMTVRAVMP